MVPGPFSFSAMPILDRLKTELDRAGRAAQNALDEGRLRLELFRARQTADRSAQRLGYAVYKAKRAGEELSTEQYAGLAADLTAARVKELQGMGCRVIVWTVNDAGRIRELTDWGVDGICSDDLTLF